jgi:hypothetical protein
MRLGRTSLQVPLHQVSYLSSRVPQAPKLQAVGRSAPAGRRLVDHVTNPHVRGLKAQAPLYLLLELNEHLIHNLHLESFIG